MPRYSRGVNLNTLTLCPFTFLPQCSKSGNFVHCARVAYAAIKSPRESYQSQIEDRSCQYEQAR